MRGITVQSNLQSNYNVCNMCLSHITIHRNGYYKTNYKKITGILKMHEGMWELTGRTVSQGNIVPGVAV